MKSGDLVRVKTSGIIWNFLDDNDPRILGESTMGDIYLVIGGPPIVDGFKVNVERYLKILTPHGEVGWIHMDYVKVVPPTSIRPVSEHPHPQ